MVKFAPRRETSPIETYYSHAEAMEFIDECERKGIRILGMEFLSLEPGGVVRPRNSTAWGDLAPAESWTEARMLLRDGIPDGGNAVGVRYRRAVGAALAA